MFSVQIDETSRNYLKSLPSEERHDGQAILRAITERGCGFLKKAVNKHGYNLDGCYYAYFGGTKHRIVAEQVSASEVVIWSIGPREQFEVYRDAHNKRNPEK